MLLQSLLTTTTLSLTYSTTRAFVVTSIYPSFERFHCDKHEINKQKKGHVLCCPASSTTPTGRVLSLLLQNTKKSQNYGTLRWMSSTNDINTANDNHNASHGIISSKNSITSTVLLQLLGGDYAGQSATFSNVDGSLIRVPEQYVPESLIEWGQIPSCLEVIVSEDWSEEEGEEDDCDCLTRTTVTVLPEVGCGIDNLETLKKKDKIPLDWYKTFAVDRYNIATCLIPNNNSRKQTKQQQQQQYKNNYRIVECTFAFHQNDDNDDDGQNNPSTVQKRIRVRVYLKDNCHEFHSSMPIEIIQERKTSENSSKGCIADGGGLDARTVMELVGKENIHKPFSEVLVAGGGGENLPLSPGRIASMMNGRWQTVCIGEEGQVDQKYKRRQDSVLDENSSSIREYNHDYWNSAVVVDHDEDNDNNKAISTKTTTTTFVLPGNVLLRKCNNNTAPQQTLELCLVVEEKREDPDMVVLDGHGMEQQQQQQQPQPQRQAAVTLHRVVVQYVFQYNDDNEDDPVVQCFLEKKLGSM